MSNPYGPPIETVQDWNAALGCCCGMPEAPGVIVEYESILGEAIISGYFPDDWVDGDPIPQRAVQTYTSYSAGAPFIQTYTRDFPTSIGIGGVTFQDPVQTLTDNGGTEFGSPITWTYFDPVTQAAARSAALAIILGGIDFEDEDQYKSAGAISERVDADAYTGAAAAGRILKIQAARYRFRVPEAHLGNYYKVTWDVLFEPVGWDDEGIPEEDRPLRYSRKNLTVEWEGPGTGAQSDPSWLAGDWQTLEIPDEPGIRKVINIRYEHMRREGA